MILTATTVTAKIRFFLGATDAREYAVLFNEGQPENPVYAFEKGKKNSGFRPEETIFALDDQPFITSEKAGIKYNTTLLQITANEEGQPETLDALPVVYGLYIEKREGLYSIGYQLDPASLEATRLKKFDLDLPRLFKTAADKFNIALLEEGTLTIENLKDLTLPPHHPSPRAETARECFGKAQIKKPATIEGDWKKPACLAATFNEGGDIVVVQELPENLRKPTPKPFG
jgi:hypothetical protein